MAEADCYRKLAEAFDDIAMWRTFVALLPWTVHVDHEAERAAERAARLLSRIPTQRQPVDLRPARLVPPRPRIQPRRLR